MLELGRVFFAYLCHCQKLTFKEVWGKYGQLQVNQITANNGC